jgi:hypothetical protein
MPQFSTRQSSTTKHNSIFGIRDKFQAQRIELHVVNAHNFQLKFPWGTL